MAWKRETVIRSAEKYVAKGKVEAAIREYRKVLKHHPADVNTLNRVGDLYARIERFDEAVRLFTQIAEQYTRDGFFVKAIAIYKKIIKLDPSSLQVYEKLAALYAEQGLITEARTQYQVLAEYYQKHDNAASAITIYQRMAELEPDNPTFQLKLAELFASRRLVDRALTSYARLADIFVVGGSIDEAAQVYLKALDLSAEDLDFVERAVRSLRDAGNLSAAGRVLAKATELNPAAAPLGEKIGLGETTDDPLSVLENEAPEPSSDTWKASELEDVELEGIESDAGQVEETPERSVEPFFLELDGIDDLLDTGSRPAPPPETEDRLEETGILGAAEAVDATEGLDLELELETDPEEEVFVFELDLDDDEVPESLVQPPADMLDEADDWTEAGARTAAGSPAEASDSEVIDLGDLDVEAETVAESTPALTEAEVAEPVDETMPEPDEPIEIDWSLDPLEELASEAEIDLAPAPADETPTDETPADEDRPMDDALVVGEPEDLAPVVEDELVSVVDAVGDLAVTQMIDASLLEADSTVEGSAAEDVADVDAAELEEAAVVEPGASDDGAGGVVSRSMRVRLAAVRREEDLLAEAQVFAKYGLREKAEERLRDLWNLNPHNLEAAQLKTRLLLEDGDYEAVMAEANDLAELADRVGDTTAWETLRSHLSEVGFRIEGGRVVAPPGEKPKKTTRISQFLEVLDGAAQATRAEAAPPAQEDAVTGEIDTALDTFFDAQASKAAARSAAQSAPPVDAPPVSLAERLGLADLADSREIEVHPPDGAPSVDEDVLDESGMSWLDETGGAASAAAATAEAKEEPVFDEDDEFFDLAAEIERELDEEDAKDLAPAGAPTEPSLEEIVEGFKRGVAEHLSAEDYDTHFNLGIAYREMGLLDEAIGEFQLSSKDARYLVDSSSMLGMSFLEKGLPDLAIKWYRKGLEAPGLEEQAMLGLLYDMAAAYEQSGNLQAAHKSWIEIYGISSTYRDVAKRIESSPTAEPV